MFDCNYNSCTSLNSCYLHTLCLCKNSILTDTQTVQSRSLVTFRKVYTCMVCHIVRVYRMHNINQEPSYLLGPPYKRCSNGESAMFSLRRCFALAVAIMQRRLLYGCLCTSAKLVLILKLCKIRYLYYRALKILIIHLSICIIVFICLFRC